MSFSMSVPDPVGMRAGKAAFVHVAAGTVLHRIHPGAYGPCEFNPSAGGSARFSPLAEAGGSIVPTIYGAETFECAACEIMLRCPDNPAAHPATGMPVLRIVSPADYAGHMHSTVLTTAGLTLVDLTVSGQRKLGVDGNALLAGPRSTYPATRRWASHIHAAFPHAHGLHYQSYQYGPHYAVMLFGDRVRPFGLQHIRTRRVADKPCHDEIAALADSLSIDYAEI